jgi:hypothetical protein
MIGRINGSFAVAMVHFPARGTSAAAPS